MADSLFDILRNKEFDVPPEIRAIKSYVAEHFQCDVDISFRGPDIIITVPSAGLANMLRYHVRDMQKAAQTNKKIILRIR